MRRVVCVFLPTWPIDRLKRRLRLGRFAQPGGRAKPAILLVKTEHGKRLIACACPQSTSQGVRAGMTLAHARALLPRHRVIEAEHDPVRDDEALRRLAQWMVRFAPIVAPDPPDGLILDVTGCHKLYHSERRMLNAIGNSLEQLRLSNRLCCASTLGGAWAVARFGKDERTTIAPSARRSALAALPIEALRLDALTIQALHEVNVDHIGDVLNLPRLELAARFDMQLLKRLDQALGEAPEAIDALHAYEPIAVERAFDGAVTNLEALFIVTHELVVEAAAQLVHQESGAVKLDLTLTRLDATPIRFACRLSRPSRDVKHLWSLLKPKVESVNMGYGIERLTLVITLAQRIAHHQHAEFAGDRAQAAQTERASGELIDTLTHRLGPERAVRVQVMESHVPERNVKLTPALGLQPTKVARAALVEADRPSQLLRQPELIEVMAVTPDGPPVWLRWRGAAHRIAQAVGPERINCEWWSDGKEGSEAKWRDYFKVQDEAGRWLWIFRAQHSGRWFAHGEWA